MCLPEIRSAPNGIRIHVAGLKGRCPRPLDDGGVPVKYTREESRQTIRRHKATVANLACLRSAFRVQYYIVDEFMRGDIPCLFTSMNAVIAAIDSR